MTAQDAPEPTDEQLAARLRAGDQTAATTLFDRHLGALRVAARARIPADLRGRLRESDLVQEAYIAAFVEVVRFVDRGRGSFQRWLRGILAHKISHEVRRLRALRREARREVRIATGAESDTLVAHRVPAPDEHAAAAERSRIVRVLIEGLPREQRTVVRLIHFEGLSFTEAAERLARTPDAVRMLHGRAMDRLGERLEARRRDLT
jgi:RNA polymerase sigma-70 factor (ECF subfamily)